MLISYIIVWLKRVSLVPRHPRYIFCVRPFPWSTIGIVMLQTYVYWLARYMDTKVCPLTPNPVSLALMDLWYSDQSRRSPAVFAAELEFKEL